MPGAKDPGLTIAKTQLLMAASFALGVFVALMLVIGGPMVGCF